MGRKAEILIEEKLRAVEDYLSGKRGRAQICNDLQIHHRSFEQWLRKYKLNGEQGLITLNHNKFYSEELKLQAARDYLEGQGSLHEICSKYHISSHGILQNRIKKYKGHEPFTSHNSKGDKIMTIRKKRKNYIPSTLQITAENVLNREFKAEKPNEKWLTDVTEFKLLNGQKAYLSAILDLCDNSIISYVLEHSNNNKLIFDTFDLAVAANPDAKPLFHSDRGFQYTNKQFKDKLDGIGAIQSMSRISRCIDNGPMEGFWGIIKSEMYYLRKFHTYEELKEAIDKYIDFYNTGRLQSRLKGLTPMEYRNQALV